MTDKPDMPDFIYAMRYFDVTDGLAFEIWRERELNGSVKYIRADKAFAVADKLTDALREVLREEQPGYHDCIDDGKSECHWCIANKALIEYEQHRQKGE